jgi:hypothetical protein
MMRSWTLPLSSWRWASAACRMGMDWCAQAEPAVGQQGDRLIQGAGSTAGGGLGQRDAEVGGGRVRQGDDPLGSAGQGDRVGQDARAGGVEDGVHRAQRADPAGHARAVPHRGGSQLAGERFVVLADRADHHDPRATASWVAMTPTDAPPPNSSSVSPLVTFSCRRTPAEASAELGSAAASIHETDSGLRV